MSSQKNAPVATLPQRVAIVTATGSQLYLTMDGQGMAQRNEAGGGAVSVQPTISSNAIFELQADTSSQYNSKRDANTVNVASTVNPNWYLRICPPGFSEPTTVNVQYTVWLLETFELHDLGSGQVAFESRQIKNYYLTVSAGNVGITYVDTPQANSAVAFRLVPMTAGPMGWRTQLTAPGGTSGLGPCVIPATAVPAVAQDLSIYLPALGDQAQAVAGTDLSLQPNLDGATKDVLPWILGIPAGSVAWSFATSANNPLPRFRAAVRTAVDTFLRQAQSAGALPRGVALLQQAIARWMPQTFDEMLFYAYGLDLTGGPGTGVIDLRPGTVLRVAFADLLQAAAVVSDPLLPGFAGGATTDFPISDNTAGDGSWQVVPDAFIARLVAGGVLSVAPPEPPAAGRTAGVADAADLFFPSFPLPFLRLFIPHQVANPSQTGDTTLSGSFSLGSAASYAELAAATPSAYFRGRAVARVMIRVVVAGESCLVPVGTTLGHILDRLAIRSPSTVRQVTIVRGAGVGQPTAAGFPASLLAPTAYPLQADWSGGNFDLADLPLLHGDRIGLP